VKWNRLPLQQGVDGLVLKEGKWNMIGMIRQETLLADLWQAGIRIYTCTREAVLD
jgi:hypothetical protein